MRYCKTCQINYDTNLEHCLLCGGDLKFDSDDHSTYKFPEVTKRKKSNFYFRFFIFLNIICALITMVIDFISGSNLSWSLIVTSTNVYSILFIFILLNPNFWASKLTKLILSSILVAVIIGLSINDYTWAVDIVFPLTIVSTMLLLTILILTNRKKWYDYFAPLFIMSLIGLIPGLLLILDVTFIHWPSVVSFLYSSITLLGIIFLPSKSSREEFKRRFHI